MEWENFGMRQFNVDNKITINSVGTWCMCVHFVFFNIVGVSSKFNAQIIIQHTEKTSFTLRHSTVFYKLSLIIIYKHRKDKNNNNNNNSHNICILIRKWTFKWIASEIEKSTQNKKTIYKIERFILVKNRNKKQKQKCLMWNLK